MRKGPRRRRAAPGGARYRRHPRPSRRQRPLLDLVNGDHQDPDQASHTVRRPWRLQHAAEAAVNNLRKIVDPAFFALSRKEKFPASRMARRLSSIHAIGGFSFRRKEGGLDPALLRNAQLAHEPGAVRCRRESHLAGAFPIPTSATSERDRSCCQRFRRSGDPPRAQRSASLKVRARTRCLLPRVVSSRPSPLACPASAAA